MNGMSKSDSTRGIGLDLEKNDRMLRGKIRRSKIKIIKLYGDTDTPPCWCSNNWNNELECVRSCVQDLV